MDHGVYSVYRLFTVLAGFIMGHQHVYNSAYNN